MTKSHRPPPLNLTPPPVASLQRQSRPSWFAGPKVVDYTPPVSVFDHEDPASSSLRTRLRISSDFLHILTNMLIIIIMAHFLSYMPGWLSDPTAVQAVVLITLLALDILLDFYSMAHYDQKWQGWALMGRLLLALAYFVIFLVYMAIGRAFPASYTYFNLPTALAGPLFYILLWFVLVWNVLYCVFCRHQFYSELRRYATDIRDVAAGRETTSSRQRRSAQLAKRWYRYKNRVEADLEKGLEERRRGHSKATSLASSVSETSTTAEKPALALAPAPAH